MRKLKSTGRRGQTRADTGVSTGAAQDILLRDSNAFVLRNAAWRRVHSRGCSFVSAARYSSSTAGALFVGATRLA